MLNLQKVSKICLLKRWYSTKQPVRNILEQLKARSLIYVKGDDVTEYLQGLITNDIHHLNHRSGGSMYAMFLNTKGRVLYDAIIYKTEENNAYYIECDKEAKESLQKHIKLYRVKRKVDVINLDSEYIVYSLFSSNSLNIHDNNETNHTNLEGMIVPCDTLRTTLPETSNTVKIYKDLLVFKDPRVVELGSRIISKIDADVKEQVKEIVNIVDVPKEYEHYKSLRYNLGIGEGLNDLPFGNCFPLECNCDYLHGISFHKGCYIGQELTARTHHTGVVRKRLMPLYFTKVPSKLPSENVILHENFNLGRLRAIEGNVGLALLRVSQALGIGEINIGNGIAKIRKPTWWPIEAPKERLNVEKN